MNLPLNLPLLWRVSLLATLAATAITGSAQPARLVWSRSSSSPGVDVDVIGDGLASGAKFVVVGTNLQAGQFPKGNITVFDRKTAATQSINIIPPSGGSLALTKIVERNGALFVFGTTRVIGSTSDQIYIGKFDAGLNLLGQLVFSANTYVGVETVTDAGIDQAGNVFLVGVAQKLTIWQMFVARTTLNLDGVAQNFAKVDLEDVVEPQLTVIEPQGALVGVGTATSALVRRYSSTGHLDWSFSSPPIVGKNIVVRLDNDLIDGHCYAGVSWVEEPTPKNFMSYATLYRVRVTDGSEANHYSFTPEPGKNLIWDDTDIVHALASRNVNALLNRNDNAQVVSFDAALNLKSTWTGATMSENGSFAAVTAWGDVLFSEVSTASSCLVRALAVNNASKFAIATPAFGLDLNWLVQRNLFHSGSGDILNMRTDGSQMQVSLIQQAPIAITDSYVATSGVTYRPPSPLTTNDRYGEGSAISVMQQPLHGTLTVGSNGFFLYRSIAGYVGQDSFTYQLAKPGLKTSQARVNITVR